MLRCFIALHYGSPELRLLLLCITALLNYGFYCSDSLYSLVTNVFMVWCGAKGSQIQGW